MERFKSFFTRNRGECATVALVLMLLLFGYGVLQLLTYSLPMHRGDFSRAYSSPCADKALVLYDQGLKVFKAGDYDGARQLFTVAYSACTDANGEIPASRKELAAKIQFMLGNSFDALRKTQQAVESYAQSLRFDSTSLYAKYDLERLLAPPPPQNGGGNGNGQTGNSGQQGNPQGQQGNPQGQQGNPQGQQGNPQGQQGNPQGQQGNPQGQQGNPQGQQGNPQGQQGNPQGQQGNQQGQPGNQQGQPGNQQPSNGAGKGVKKGI